MFNKNVFLILNLYMSSSRVYRKRLSNDYIVSELENNKGTQFDLKIADIMLNFIKDGKVKIEE